MPDLDQEALERIVREAVTGPDGHRYLSTYYAHDDHGHCRLHCKGCQAPCICSCHTNTPTPCTDCGYPEGRQSDCRTCGGQPILEDGETR